MLDISIERLDQLLDSSHFKLSESDLDHFQKSKRAIDSELAGDIETPAKDIADRNGFGKHLYVLNLISHELEKKGDKLDLTKDDHQKLLGLGYALLSDRQDWSKYSKDERLLMAIILQNEYTSQNVQNDIEKGFYNSLALGVSVGGLYIPNPLLGAIAFGTSTWLSSEADAAEGRKVAGLSAEDVKLLLGDMVADPSYRDFVLALNHTADAGEYIVSENLKDEKNDTNNSQKDEIVSLLRQAGVEHVDEALQKLLSESKITREALNNVLKFWQAAQDEKKAKEAEVLCHSVYASCQFVSALADRVNSPILKKFAIAAQSGAQIYQSLGQLSKLSGIALLNPIAAIGMAGLNIVSLFGGGQQNQEMKVLMKQLSQISKQVNNLHKDTINGLQKTKEHIHLLLKLTLSNFENIHYLLKEQVQRQLSDIQNDIDILLSLTTEGFKTVILSDLNEVLHGIEFMVDKDEDQRRHLVQEHYGKYMQKLHQMLTKESCQRLLTGLVYAPNVDGRDEVMAQLFEKSGLGNRVIHMLGLLFFYLKEKLKLPAFSQVKVESIINVEVWVNALTGYADLLKMRSELFRANHLPISAYDPSLKNVTGLKAQADIVSGYIGLLQTDKSLYEHIFSDIAESNLKLSLVAQSIIQEFTKTTKVDLRETNFEKMIASFQGATPQNMQVSCRNGSRKPPKHPREFNENVIDYINSNPQEVLSRLPQSWAVLFSKELLMAEHLGLLKYTCRCYVYKDCVAKEKEGAALGLEIAVEFNGKKIVLFKPTVYRDKSSDKSRHKHRNTNHPSVVINRAIAKTCSADKDVPGCSHNQVIQMVRDLVKQKLQQDPLLTNKTQLANTLQDKITSNSEYKKLRLNLNLLNNCLQAAGFNNEVLSLMQKLLTNYSPNPQAVVNNIIDPELLTELGKLINKIMDNKSTMDFASPIVELVQSGLQKLAEIQTFVTFKEEQPKEKQPPVAVSQLQPGFFYDSSVVGNRAIPKNGAAIVPAAELPNP